MKKRKSFSTLIKYLGSGIKQKSMKRLIRPVGIYADDLVGVECKRAEKTWNFCLADGIHLEIGEMECLLRLCKFKLLILLLLL